MEIDKDLELVCEKYLTQRLYSSRVPLSDGFMASLTKEFHQLTKEGYSVDRIIKKIMFELKKLDAEPEKEVKDKILRPLTGGIQLPNKEIEVGSEHMNKEPK